MQNIIIPSWAPLQKILVKRITLFRLNQDTNQTTKHKTTSHMRQITEIETIYETYNIYLKEDLSTPPWLLSKKSIVITSIPNFGQASTKLSVII